MKHIPVLLNETINYLDIKPDGIYVDCTLGRAGHSSQILKRIKNGFLYAFDKDEEAIKESKEKLKKISSNFELIKSDFKDIKSELNKRKIDQVDGIIADFGVSSPQLDQESRGFSYNFDNSILDMRMDRNQKFSAIDVINEYSQKELSYIINKYGDEKFHNQISKNIINKRKENKITKVKELKEIIDESIPFKFKKNKNPYKKTFQAIRVEVNNEISSIKKLLASLSDLLKIDAKAIFISFNSLEDRTLMKYFNKIYKQKINSPFEKETSKPSLELISKKVIKPSDDEIEKNQRSKSSLMRVIIKNY